MVPTCPKPADSYGKSSNVSVEHWQLGDLRFSWLAHPGSEFPAGFVSGVIVGYLPWLIIGLGYVLGRAQRLYERVFASRVVEIEVSRPRPSIMLAT